MATKNIVGIVFGVFFGVLFIALGVFFFCKYKKRKALENGSDGLWRSKLISGPGSEPQEQDTVMSSEAENKSDLN